MKKLLYSLLAILMVLTGVLSFAIYAQPELPTFSVTSTQGAAGEEVTVTVEMSDNPGISALGLQIYFDRDQLELVKAVRNGPNVKEPSDDPTSDSFYESKLTGNDFYEGLPFTFNWINTNATISDATTLYTLTFKIKDNAKAGDVEIRVAYDQMDVFDSQFNDVVFETVSGKVTVHTYGDWISGGADHHEKSCECGETITAPHNWNEGEVTTPPTATVEGEKTYTCTDCGETKVEDIPVLGDILYGDANGDGAINGKDVLLLRKYMANYDYDTETSTETIYPGADANGDEVVNGKDVLLLRKYMANYDYDTNSSTVVLGPNA